MTRKSLHRYLLPMLLLASAWVMPSLMGTQCLQAAPELRPGTAADVDPLIGTKGAGLASGYLYPGATYPFGMVQFTPSYFSKRSGFVIDQLSGAGCEHMGHFPTFPLKGELTFSPNDIHDLGVEVTDEQGHAGYYTCHVQDDVEAHLTVTPHTGMARYVFPQGETRGTVVIGAGVAATPISQAAVVITSNHSCEGYADGGNFCGYPTPYKVYFAAEFDADAVTVGTWKDQTLKAGNTFAEGTMSGVWFTFDVSRQRTLHYRVGVSYVSVENARENLRAENAAWDFDATVHRAEEAWNDQLGRIAIATDNADRRRMFYTLLYRSLIHPNIDQDVNGEYMGADFKVHTTHGRHFTSFSNWDTYRTQIQLLAMLDPDVASDVVQSHQLFAEQAGGAFPRWVMANIETGIMQGDPTPILIANAWAFGARNYNPRAILRTMQIGANTPGARCQKVEARPMLRQYIDKGYCRASLQLEYTSSDFAISRFARLAAGDEFASWGYASRARSWKNLWDEETGWLRSRAEDGSWKSLYDDWMEATYKNYFWMVPYDLGGLIELMGGKEAAERRLDELFLRLDAGYGDAWYAAGNEPSFAIPWAYNWVGTPWKTQQVINRVLNDQYTARIDGLPGNDDLGTMGAWYVFACLGLYPEIPAVGGFAIHTPIFPEAVIHLKRGDIRIEGGSEKNIYIQKLTVNGNEHASTWVDWDDLCDGATLRFTTSSKPCKTWGTAVEPPSFH